MMELSDMLQPQTVRHNLSPLKDKLEFTEYTVTAIPTNNSVEGNDGWRGCGDGSWSWD